MLDTPNLLVIRHEPCTSLGLLAAAVRRAGVSCRYLNISEGDVLAEPITAYSHIVTLGGAISAYESDRYTFLTDEFKLLETAIDRHIPTLGICLGAQILATVLGAPVYRGAAGREAGWCDLKLTAAGQQDPLLHDFPEPFKVFQSHQDTFDIPASCTHLATSATYPHQAFRYQDHVWAIQFHLEMDENVLGNCAAVIQKELDDSQIHAITLPQILAAAAQHSPTVAPLADRFMQRFLQIESP